jgi:hypothetical protein
MKLKIFLLLTILTFTQSSFAQAKTVKRPIKKVVKKATPKKLVAQNFANKVQFVYQITGSSWSNPIFADACEESTVLMAAGWYKGINFSASEIHDKILSMAEYEQEKFGYYQDTSVADTALILNQTQGVPATVSYGIGIEAIKKALARNSIVIVPINGQFLNNPGYTYPGPPRHMIVVFGYDPETDQFIVNDPGTRIGQGQSFKASTLQNALQDYSTGNHIHVSVIQTAMIEINKNDIPLTQ